MGVEMEVVTHGTVFYEQKLSLGGITMPNLEFIDMTGILKPAALESGVHQLDAKSIHGRDMDFQDIPPFLRSFGINGEIDVADTRADIIFGESVDAVESSLIEKRQVLVPDVSIDSTCHIEGNFVLVLEALEFVNERRG